MADQQQEKEQYLVIDGAEYDLGTDSLTFGEQRKLRRYVRELAGDPDLDLTEAALMDFLPALVTVIKQRNTGTGFTLEMADELKWDDVIREREADPTPEPAGATRTRGRSGTPK
jgi:hypothetical protein